MKNLTPVSILYSQPQKHSSKLKVYILCSLFLTTLVLSGILYYFSSSTTSEILDSYIELRIIDMNGFSVPGADIYVNNNLVGTSDAFGEIRNNIEAIKNSDLTVKVTKPSTHLDKTFSFKMDGSKNIVKTLQI